MKRRRATRSFDLTIEEVDEFLYFNFRFSDFELLIVRNFEDKEIFCVAGWPCSAMHPFRPTKPMILAPTPSLSIPRVTKEKIRKKWT